jgi:hypothetical protein
MSDLPATYAAIPLDHPLTFEACIERGQQPIYSGATVDVRFQFRTAADVPISLQGASGSMSITAGTTTIEIAWVADGDQTVETGDTGIGWYTVPFVPSNTDVATVAGRRRDYKVKITEGDGTVTYPHVAGKIDIGV